MLGTIVAALDQHPLRWPVLSKRWITYRKTVTDAGENLHVETLGFLAANLNNPGSGFGRKELIDAGNSPGNGSYDFVRHSSAY